MNNVIQLRPAAATAVFRMPGFHLWDPSVVEAGGRFHLFASRWPAAAGFEGWRGSHVIRATAEHLFGPYSFAQVVAEPRPDGWDSVGVHNPKILRVGSRLLLYHLGIPAWQTGFMWADGVEGPWRRGDRPTIPANNPALWVHDDGSVYVLAKKRSPFAPDVRPWTNWMQAFTAPHIAGPYTEIDPLTNRLPEGCELEDPTVWHDGRRYHAVVTDWKGLVTGIDKAGLHFVSADGVSYSLVSQTPLFTQAIELESGWLALERRERPQIVLGPDGGVVAMCTAILEAGGESAVVIQPAGMNWP